MSLIEFEMICLAQIVKYRIKQRNKFLIKVYHLILITEIHVIRLSILQYRLHLADSFSPMDFVVATRFDKRNISEKIKIISKKKQDTKNNTNKTSNNKKNKNKNRKKKNY